MEFFLDFFWLDLLLEYLIKSTLVLLCALLLAFFLRKQSASLRHLAFSIALIGTLLFPVLSTVQSGWKTKLIPTWSTRSQSSIAMDISVIDQSRDPRTLNENTRSETQKYGNEAAERSKKIGTNSTPLWNVMKYSLLSIWLFGLVFILSRQISGLFGAYRLTRKAEKLTSLFWCQLLDRFLESLSLKKKVDLLKHKKVKVPLTWGWLKPVVIMPHDSKFWTASQRESALYHELSHVKRGDFLVMTLSRLSLGLYWFNPIIWLVFHLMKKEQEKACDELVLKTGIKPSAYAANLLSIRRSIRMPWNPPTAAVGAIGRSQLNDRLIAILKQKFRFKEVKMRTKISLATIFFLAIVFLGMARPSPSSLVVFSSTAISFDKNVQEEQAPKADQEKAEKQKDKEKKKNIFVWHLAEGEEAKVDVVINDNGKFKTLTIIEPVIVIKKDDTGKEIVLTSKGKVDIKKDEKWVWISEGDALTLHEQIEELDLGEGSVIMLKTETKDGHKFIEIKAPAVIIKKIDDISKQITIKTRDAGEKEKTVVVSPHIHAVHPDVEVKLKETELEKIHEKLQNIHERLSKKVEPGSEEAEQALEDMEETLKKMEKKLKEMESSLKEINVSIHEEPHHLRLKLGRPISIKHKINTEEGKEGQIYITKDEHPLISFVNESGEAIFVSRMDLEKTQKQTFIEAVEKLERDIPEGYDIESEFDDESGNATIKIKGSAVGKETSRAVMNLLEELKKKLEIKN